MAIAAGLDYRTLHASYKGYNNMTVETFAACSLAIGVSPAELLKLGEEALIEEGKAGAGAEALARRCLELDPEPVKGLLDRLRAQPVAQGSAPNEGTEASAEQDQEDGEESRNEV